LAGNMVVSFRSDLKPSTDIHDHKMLEQRLKLSNEAARAAEAEHKKRAEDALETRRQQEFFIVFIDPIDLTLGYGFPRTSKSSQCHCSKFRCCFEFPQGDAHQKAFSRQ